MARSANERRLRAGRWKKNAAFLQWLKAVPCIDCGRCFPPECMDFDHVRGVKKFGISDGPERSLAALLEELQKCEVVCANCHRIRTRRRAAA